MSTITQMRVAAGLLATLLLSLAPATHLRAEDKIERSAVAAGLTAGNLLFVPLKALAVSTGALTGALSFVLMGGDQEVAQQTWRDTLQGPYIITPEVARKAIGERPELDSK